jgi:hypothetical protein
MIYFAFNRQCGLFGIGDKRGFVESLNIIFNMRRNTMAYSKPVVLAQNSANGSFAAGCPAQGTSNTQSCCKGCERAH